MKWAYKASLFLLLLSQSVFFLLAIYHTDANFYYPEGDLEADPTIGYSWIWYHQEQWMICVVLNFMAVLMFFYGLLDEKRNWKLSNLIEVKIEEEEEETF